MGYENVGKVWDVRAFGEWIRTQDLSWAQGVTLHHTAAPSLEQRKQGMKIQHMRNLAHYYGNKLGWSAGPHLFTDDDQVFGLSSIERRGVHAKSFNSDHIGIEVLGNYDLEDPKSGRGLACWETTAGVVSAILRKQKWTHNHVNFHRDDPKTSKTCPGSKVSKEWFFSLLPRQDDRVDDRGGDESGDIESALESIEWQVRKIREALR